jgi:hypothetical protein
MMPRRGFQMADGITCPYSPPDAGSATGEFVRVIGALGALGADPSD